MNLKDINYPKLFDNAMNYAHIVSSWLDKAKCIDFVAPLMLRLYLAPVLWMAGTHKFASFKATVEWFGNAEWGLGLPAPWLMVLLVASFEFFGAMAMLTGLGVRLMSLPLMVIMAVAGYLVHWKNGWLAIAEGTGIFATDRTRAAAERLARAKEILQTNGDYTWLTEQGNFVILNNGIEFAATYFVMLLALFFMGGGRYVSLDYWLKKRFAN